MAAKESIEASGRTATAERCEIMRAWVESTKPGSSAGEDSDTDESAKEQEESEEGFDLMATKGPCVGGTGASSSRSATRSVGGDNDRGAEEGHQEEERILSLLQDLGQGGRAAVQEPAAAARPLPPQSGRVSMTGGTVGSAPAASLQTLEE
jgi:hypothetical protein